MYQDRFGNEFHTQMAADLSQVLTHYSEDREHEIASVVRGLDDHLHTLETRIVALETKSAERDQEDALAESVAIWGTGDAK